MGLKENIYSKSPVIIQNMLISAYGYTWMKRRFGGVFKAEYAKAKERESFTTAQWQQYQAEKLTSIIQHAYNTVLHYKETFSVAGINSGIIRGITPETISCLPVLSKEQLRKYGTTTLLSVQREQGGSFFASSGSTGTPTQILLSHAMHQRWFALFECRVRNWAGVNSFIPRGMIGGRRILPSHESSPPFYRYNYFEKQVYFSAYHINAANAKNYVRGMRRYGVKYMTGYAMSNFILARFLKEQKIDAPQMQCIITSSEKLTQEMRDMFKEVYGCKTFDGWSGVEACGLVTECEHGSLHVSPDAGILEVLGDNMQPVAPGTAGTAYCTGFLNYDQPLIRYNIGDTMILSPNACKCGRAMPVVQEIAGRVEDVVIGKDGREMVRFHGIFNGLHSVKQAQVIQDAPGDIIIKVVVADKTLSLEETALIKQRIESQLGEMNVVIEIVDSIPITANGKYKAVISNVKRKQPGQ